MIDIPSDHNQSLGFNRYQKTAPGREETREVRSQRIRLQEVRIADAKQQLLETGKIKNVLAVIGGGKEATVLLAEGKDRELVCAKVFRFFTSTIKKRLRGTKHLLPNDMARLAAKQEYWNLTEMVKHVRVPAPKFLDDNIVVMELIREEKGSHSPAPLLRDVDLRNFGDPGDFLEESIEILARIFLDGQYIHGDYSEFNLMISLDGVLYTMDVSQSVQFNSKTFIETPIRIRIDRAVEFLKTDITNIVTHFRRAYRLWMNIDEIVDEICDNLAPHLRQFLDEKTMKIYPGDLFSTAMYEGKEQFRNSAVYERTGTLRQRPK